MHYISNPTHSTILPRDLALFESLVPAIKATTDVQLRSVGTLAPSLQLASEGACEVWYTAFDCLNQAAKLALVGITPGERQLLDTMREAREQLRRGPVRLRSASGPHHLALALCDVCRWQKL